MSRCGSCGQENDEQAKFCLDCGKPIVGGSARMISVEAATQSGPAGPVTPAAPTGYASEARAARPATDAVASGAEAEPESFLRACAGCGATVDARLPFCAYCGARVATSPGAPAPPKGVSGTAAGSAAGKSGGVTASHARLALINNAGAVVRTIALEWAEASIGRIEGNVRFADDPYLSPMHAQFSCRDGQVFVRDLGSRNGTWLFIDEPYRLQDGDTLLIGSQILRFRRLGYPGPNPPEADRTRRRGSRTPSADVALLAQLRADGSARDTYHLSPGRTVMIGREEGDWLFPFDQTMSGRHAEVRGEDLEFIVIDAGSRNGIAVAVRGEKVVKVGQKLMMGDQTMRVESL